MSDKDPTSISLRGHDGQVVIDILDWNENSRSSSDAKWLSCNVSFRSASCSFSARVALVAYEIGDFHRELKKMQAELGGSARMSTVEETISLEVAMNPRTGSVNVSGKLRESGMSIVEVTFRFDSDQSYVRATLVQLGRVVEEHLEAPGSQAP